MPVTTSSTTVVDTTTTTQTITITEHPIIYYQTQYHYMSTEGYISYWLPLLVCAIGYTYRTIENYKTDVIERDAYLKDAKKGYYPKETLGHIIGRIVISILPLINILYAIFDVLPSILKWLYQIFDIPLVPKPNKDDDID